MNRRFSRIPGAMLASLALTAVTSPTFAQYAEVQQATHTGVCGKCGQAWSLHTGGTGLGSLLKSHRNCPPPPTYAPYTAPTTPADPNAPYTPPADGAAPDTTAVAPQPAPVQQPGVFASNTGGFQSGGRGGVGAVMFGDQSSLPARILAVPKPGTGGGGGNTGIRRQPSGPIRGLKFSENQTPKPVDRVSYSFNYFNDINRDVNQRFASGVSNVNAYRHIFGLEKTFFDENMSVGLRLPLNTITGNSSSQATSGIGRTSTALGDLNVYTKIALLEDRETGNILSAGLSMSLPTGPTNFGNAQWLSSLHYIQFQPYLGLYYNWDDFYVIAFTSVNVPGNNKDVTQYFNDIGIGYFLYTNPDEDAWVRKIAPFFEAHINTPLNHRDVFNPLDIAGSADVVNLTYGVNLFTGKRSLLSFGMTNPITGPRPFALEAGLILNVFY